MSMTPALPSEVLYGTPAISSIRTSPEVNAIAEAMAKAQAAMTAAARTGDNPYYDSSYATLASCWETCRIPLGENGLSVWQVPSMREGRILVVTRIMHASGQWVEGEMLVRPGYMKAGNFIEASDPQAMGSAIAYSRRYSLCAMVGIPQADDDGAAASGKTPEKARGDGQRYTPKPEPADKRRRPRGGHKEDASVSESTLRVQLRTDLVTWSRCSPEEVRGVSEMVLRYLGLPINVKLDNDQLTQAISFVQKKLTEKSDYDAWLDNIASTAAEPAESPI